MSAAAAALPSGGLQPREGALWAAAFAVVLAFHLAAGLAFLDWSPETAPTEAPEPIAMIDLPPAPALPEAVTTADLPPADALSVPVEAAREIGGTTVPDLAPEAPEAVDAPVETVEHLPPETAEPPPVPTARPSEMPVAEAVPPEPVAEAVPEVVPDVAPMDAAPAAVESPVEAAPILPDAAVVLSAPVALPPVRPAEVPPPAQPVARQSEAKKTERREAERKEPAARKAERTAEKPAAKAPAGPAAAEPKAGGRQQQTASAPRSAGGGATADVLRQYQAKVRADIEREVQRIPVTRSGVATIRFTFSRQGAVSDVAVARSSGDAGLDRAALTAVKRASPLPAAPPELSQPTFTMSVPIRLKAR